MRFRDAILFLGAAALAQPPVAASAHVITIPACGGGEVRHLRIPGDPDDPAERRDCAKACHAIGERRSRPGAGKGVCC
jgi:hypothetical protein